MSKENNKGKGSLKRSNQRKKEKASRTSKATAEDILKLKQHFDKKFGRK